MLTPFDLDFDVSVSLSPISLPLCHTPHLLQPRDKRVFLADAVAFVYVQATGTTLLPKSDSEHSPTSLPHVPPTDFNELFDLTSQFRDLLELPPVVSPPSLPALPEGMPNGGRAESTAADEVSTPTELASTQVDDVGTPLSLVALLYKPEKTPRPGVLNAPAQCH